MAEVSWRVWGTPANFNSFASWLRYCTDVAENGVLFFRTQIAPERDFCDLMNSIQQSAPPIFSCAAITLGIGPHSSSRRKPLGICASALPVTQPTVSEH